MLDNGDKLCQHCGYYEVHDRSDDQREEGLIGAASDKIAYLCEIQHGDVADNRCFLDEGDHIIAVDWKEMLRRLGKDDLEETLPLRVAQCRGCLKLPLSYRIAADTQHVDHRTGEHQREAHHGYPCAAEGRRAEYDVIENHQKKYRRHAVNQP